MTGNFKLLVPLIGLSALFISSFAIPESELPPDESRICEGTCDQDYDVVFILDRSTEVPVAVFDSYLQSIKDIIDALDVGPATTHVSLVASSYETEVIIKLNQNNNAQFLKDFVSGSIEHYGSRDIGEALSVARLEALTPSNGDRAGVLNVCILYTTADAASNSEYALLEDVCQVIVFNNGGSADADTFASDVCPTAGGSTLNCTAELCCSNGGDPALAFNGCCKCSCPIGLTGTYCEDTTDLSFIELSTYQGGDNPDWYITSTSTDSRHPIEDMLRRSNALDSHDNYGSFARGDINPKLTIHFDGPAEYKLHFIEGQFTSRSNGLRVRVKFFNEGGLIWKTKFILRNGGPGDYPELAYQNFVVDGNGRTVTDIGIDFKDLEGKRGEVGINDLFAVYNKVTNGTVTMSCANHNCGYDYSPQWVNGCCKCIPVSN